jgi:hypothetical protein
MDEMVRTMQSASEPSPVLMVALLIIAVGLIGYGATFVVNPMMASRLARRYAKYRGRSPKNENPGMFELLSNRMAGATAFVMGAILAYAVVDWALGIR